MEKAIFVAAVLLVAGAAGLVPANADERVPTFGFGPLTAELVIETIGYQPAEIRMTTYEPGPVEKIITWDEFVDLLALTAASQSPTVPTVTPDGIDVGQGVSGGVFCDNSSFWSYHQSGPGASVVLAEQLGPGTDVCFGLYGPAYQYLAILDTGGLSNLVYEGCFATTWAVNADGYCPNPFAAGGAWSTAVIVGNGVLTTFDYGGGWAFDYFLGDGATIVRTTRV